MRVNDDIIISLKQVSLTLSGADKQPISILEDIDLQVNKQEAISIIGPSGSGKTSLLMIIAGVERASAGKVIIAGEDITSRSEDELAAFRGKNIGLVFQNFHLIPTMSALENVSIALEIAGHSNAKKQAIESLKSVGLEQRLYHYPNQLSGGEQQRVALARAFAVKPKILLADEPTGNLDSENSKQVIELLFSLKEECGTTLLLITHDSNLANKASRQLMMQNGKLYEK